ncbi:MAG: prepilin-type N-terminal cleavage/methylation domain-containing protein [Candidatus Omnitrophica bacterium]|nr:prepilin-type N-terminal cleavage/methylation domain-containing protein [Candidatus Omnitrophota bacterium]
MRRGFTLIELIVVIAIIAVLGAIIAPNAFKAIEKAKIAKIEEDLKAIKTGALAYYADTGIFPVDDDTYVHSGTAGRRRGIDFLENKAGVAAWDGPYLEGWPRNPFWVTTAGDYEEGYQWEGDGPTGAMDFNGDGLPDPCVEMGFVSLSDASIQYICRIIDSHMDDGNVLTGNFRLSGRWADYRVVQ